MKLHALDHVSTHYHSTEPTTLATTLEAVGWQRLHGLPGEIARLVRYQRGTRVPLATVVVQGDGFVTISGSAAHVETARAAIEAAQPWHGNPAALPLFADADDEPPPLGPIARTGTKGGPQ